MENHIPALIIDNEINTAFTEIAETVPNKLTEHSRKFGQGIYKMCDRYYLAYGYGIANSTIIVGDNGLIIIDCTESLESGTQIFSDVRKFTDLPVKAIIYTHNHLDHVGGVKAFTSQEDVDNGNVEIYAHEKLMEGIQNTASIVGPIINTRAIYTFGIALDSGPKGFINNGLGPRFSHGRTTFIQPTHTFSDRLELEICGIKMILQYAPSETEDEIFIWFPNDNVIQTADILMGECYPNIHTIRGSKYRDPVSWYKAVDMLRSCCADYMIPSHGRPLQGKEYIEEVLTSYRDAIQYTHDQTIRYMNKGYTPDELVEVLNELPPHLQNHPWLGQFYGDIRHCVRQIYQGYLGWFEGDPTFLDPLTKTERSKKYVELMGGINRVWDVSQELFDKKEYKMCAELLTHIIQIDPKNSDFKLLKSNALENLGFKTININWRNWYLTSAKELRNEIDYGALAKMGGVDSNEIVSSIPTENFLQGLCIRIDPNKSQNSHVTMGFYIKKSDEIVEHHALEIRRGIVQYHKIVEDKLDILFKTDIGIITDAYTLRMIFLRKIQLVEAVNKGFVQLFENTKLEQILEFFNYFDLNGPQFPLLTNPKIINLNIQTN